MTLLQVETEDFVAAARLMSDRVADPVRVATGTLTRTLDGCASMAGHDPGGAAWAAAYDDAARSVLTATTQFVNGAFRTSALLGRSALTYARAEAASTSGGSAVAPPVLPPDQFVGPAAVGSAGGGSGDTPAGWWLISHTVGYVWPDGHQDRLRRAGAAWYAGADALDDAASVVGYAGLDLVLDGLPEGPDIRDVCTDLNHRLLALAQAHRELSTACIEFARQLDHCHTEATAELSELITESIGIQIVGGLLGAMTFGAAEAPAQGVQAVRIALVAERVGRLIDRFVLAAERLGHTFSGVKAAGEEVMAALRRLPGAHVPGTPAFAGVPNLGRSGWAMHSVSEGSGGIRAAGGAGAAAERLGTAGNSIKDSGLALERVPQAAHKDVIDAVARARAQRFRFPAHDGKTFRNYDHHLPPGIYQEWTAAAAGARRGVWRVIIEGNPSAPNAIYFWDHVHPPVLIG